MCIEAVFITELEAPLCPPSRAPRGSVVHRTLQTWQKDGGTDGAQSLKVKRDVSVFPDDSSGISITERKREIVFKKEN